MLAYQHPFGKTRFVMIESAMCNTFIISSNCPNGPREFIKNDRRGLLFGSNNLSSLVEKFDYFIDLSKEQIIKKIEAKKKQKITQFFSYRKIQQNYFKHLR